MNLKNRKKPSKAVFNYNEAKREKLFKDVFAGIVSPIELPNDLYLALFEKFESGLYEGFGKSLMDIKFGTPDYELLSELRENISRFSSAKTFQQVREMTDAVTEGDKIVSFKEFKDSAVEIFNRYNGDMDDPLAHPGWLEAEYQNTIGQAQAAEKWNDIYKQKHILPMVRRIVTEDELTCEICGPLDGFTAPADDPIWNEIGGPAHFRCRCIDEQNSDEVAASSEERYLETETHIKEKVPEDFRFNPAKERVIFQDKGSGKHEYFTVPKEYKEFAKENFGMPVPPVSED